jgi:hypothetical protein
MDFSNGVNFRDFCNARDKVEKAGYRIISILTFIHYYKNLNKFHLENNEKAFTDDLNFAFNNGVIGVVEEEE